MNDMDSLNDAQRQAASHTTGPLLVVAGAGTGKTKVITTRMAHLIATGAALPSEILALTFTEKAAREMADRLGSLIGWQALSVSVMTFNAFGSQLLSEYGIHIGRNISGGLLNETQKSLLLMQRYNDIELIYYGPQVDTYGFVTRITAYIGRLQNAGVSAAAYSQYAQALTVSEDVSADDIREQLDLARLYDSYEAAKRATGTFDYYDQLALPLEILQSHQNIAARLGKRFKFILVDEYQDTSPVQDAILREIVPPGGNLFAVGDDDQAIYGFRGADIANIQGFTSHYGVKLPVALVQNYRSGQPILDAAYRLITHNNPDRLETQLNLDKRLVGQTQNGQVSFTAYRSPSEELEQTVGLIERRLATGEKAANVAVLARSNAKLRDYAAELRAKNIPYAISTAVNIFEQRELKNLWYVLNWVGQRVKEEAIGHIMLGPLMDWPAEAWRAVVERARADASSLETALRSEAAGGNERAKLAVARLDTWRAWASELTVAGLGYQIVFTPADAETPLGLRLQERAASSSGQVQLRIFRVFEDMARLFGHMNDFASVAQLTSGDVSLASYLAAFPVPPTLEVAETDGDADGVQLLTVHASKGLEFPVVYVVNTTERSWSEPASMGALEVPAVLARQTDTSPVHEQRRLMYVAATRAKTELLMSAPVASEGGQRQRVSQLVSELLGEEPSLVLNENDDQLNDKSLQKIHRFAPLQSELPDRMPFERDDGWIYLGVSDLYSYSRDPHAFMLEKVLKITRSSSWKARFGVLIHAAIQQYYEGVRQSDIPSKASLIERIGQGWSNDGFDDEAQSAAALRVAESTINRFYDRECGLTRVVQAVEYPIVLDIPEAKLRLSGRIDAMFITPAGLEVRDFKTGDKRGADTLIKAAKDSFQLRTYALALEVLSGTAPSLVTLDYVVTGSEGSAQLTPLILKNHRAKLVSLAESLRARDFSPRAGAPGFPTIAEQYYGDDDDQLA